MKKVYLAAFALSLCFSAIFGYADDSAFAERALTVISNLQDIQARSSLEASAFCHDQVKDLYKKSTQNVALASMFLGDSEVTTSTGKAMTQMSILKDHCARDYNDTLRHVPSMDEALEANNQLSGEIGKLLPRVIQIHSQLSPRSE